MALNGPSLTPSNDEIIGLLYEDFLSRKKSQDHQDQKKIIGRPKGPVLCIRGNKVEFVDNEGSIVTLIRLKRESLLEPSQHRKRMLEACELLDSKNIDITINNIKRLGIGSGTVVRYRTTLPQRYQSKLDARSKKRKINSTDNESMQFKRLNANEKHDVYQISPTPRKKDTLMGCEQKQTETVVEMVERIIEDKASDDIKMVDDRLDWPDPWICDALASINDASPVQKSYLWSFGTSHRELHSPRNQFRLYSDLLP